MPWALFPLQVPAATTCRSRCQASRQFYPGDDLQTAEDHRPTRINRICVLSPAGGLAFAQLGGERCCWWPGERRRHRNHDKRNNAESTCSLLEVGSVHHGKELAVWRRSTQFSQLYSSSTWPSPRIACYLHMSLWP